MSGFKRRNQLPRLRRQASLTPRAKPRFLPQRRRDISCRRRNQPEMGLLGERLSTITTSAPPAKMQFDRASCRTKSAVSPHWRYLTITTDKAGCCLLHVRNFCRAYGSDVGLIGGSNGTEALGSIPLQIGPFSEVRRGT